jgi:hypothetical protein
MSKYFKTENHSITKLKKYKPLRLITRKVYGSHVGKLPILDFIPLAAGCSSFSTNKRDLKIPLS